MSPPNRHIFIFGLAVRFIVHPAKGLSMGLPVHRVRVYDIPCDRTIHVYVAIRHSAFVRLGTPKKQKVHLCKNSINSIRRTTTRKKKSGISTGHDPGLRFGRVMRFSEYRGSGRVGSGRVGSGRVGSGRVGSGQVGSGGVRNLRGRV